MRITAGINPHSKTRSERSTDSFHQPLSLCKFPVLTTSLLRICNDLSTPKKERQTKQQAAKASMKDLTVISLFFLIFSFVFKAGSLSRKADSIGKSPLYSCNPQKPSDSIPVKSRTELEKNTGRASKTVGKTHKSRSRLTPA